MVKNDGTHVFESADDQNLAIERARLECMIKGAYDVEDENEILYSYNSSHVQNTGSTCPPIWDGILCWPATLAGELQSQNCPGYFAGFDHQAEATRLCTNESRWFVNAEHNRSWTNYSMCYSDVMATVVVRIVDVGNVSHSTNTLRHWMPVLKRMSQAGYSVSLISLLIAFCILATTKKLRCPRNTLHMHLFVSFILRAFMALLKDTLFVQGVGLSSDVVVKNGESYFSQQEHNWACKCVTSVWQFCIMANYSWILMEGLYLHNLIFLALFTDSSAITLYVLLGWGLPVIVVVPWVALRTAFEDTFCWTTHINRALSLVTRIPISLSILINFIFFINIVRVLFLKLRSSISEETRRYRKWARSTLVLVPLFGVHYSLFLALELSIGNSQTGEILWLFGDQLLASFQGFCVAVLYCFLNGEVRSEMHKKWRHWHCPWHTEYPNGFVSGRGSTSENPARSVRERNSSKRFSASIAKLFHWSPNAYAISSCTSMECAGQRMEPLTPLCQDPEPYNAIVHHNMEDLCCRAKQLGTYKCNEENHAACQGLLQRTGANDEIHLEMRSFSP